MKIFKVNRAKRTNNQHKMAEDTVLSASQTPSDDLTVEGESTSDTFSDKRSLWKKIKPLKKSKTSSRAGFLSNMKLGPRMLVCFLTIALLTTGMGLFGSFSLITVSDASKAMYSDILLPTKSIVKISRNFDKQCITLRQALFTEANSIVVVTSSLTSVGAQIKSDLDMLNSFPSMKGIESLQTLNEAYDAYVPIFNKALEKVKNGDKRSVIKDYTSFGDLRRAEDKVAKAIENFSYKITEDSLKISTNNNKTAQTVLYITLGAVGLVLVLSILIGTATARSISKPIKKLTKNATLLAAGETDIELNHKVSRDEIGQMNQAFKTIVHAIKHLEKDTDLLIDAAMEGQLSVRADASSHQGTYRRIVEGINATLDATVTPMNKSASVLKELSEGHLSARVDDDFKGDFALIKEVLNSTIDTLKAYISDITYILGQMAQGILTVSVEAEYKGDFAALKSALNSSIRSFNSLLLDINRAAEEVSAGSEQVSASSQVISQGAADQASAIEELTASITQIAEQTKRNAERAGLANELSMEAKEHALSGNAKMEQLQKAMEDINESSANISKIIKVIDDIAFQTNILALNAAVEAARAGVHGKGFAVVAEEVRNLAARSAEAAKETTALIDSSINKTKAGTQLVNVTAEALMGIVKGVEKTVSLSGEIADASNQQATGISQINRGIVQLSGVVQNNSATAQQVAASSEEMSAQAFTLKDLVGKFQLTDSDKLPQIKL